MKRYFFPAAGLLMLLSIFFSGCGNKSSNHYHVHFKTLRQNTQPAVGFNVDAWVKGKSEPETKATGADGIVVFDDLPTPDTQHQLVAILHYYNGKVDGKREIVYPFIPSDAERLKDTQYIPNN